MQAHNLSQLDLIEIHENLRADAENTDNAALRPHYEYILTGLKKLIEYHGPTAMYREWLRQLEPPASDKRTIPVDLDLR